VDDEGRFTNSAVSGGGSCALFTVIGTVSHPQEELAYSPRLVIHAFIKSRAELKVDGIEVMGHFVVDIHNTFRVFLVGMLTKVHSLSVLEVLVPGELAIHPKLCLFIVPRVNFPELELNAQLVVRRQVLNHL
jgi:hypothetical protein